MSLRVDAIEILSKTNVTWSEEASLEALCDLLDKHIEEHMGGYGWYPYDLVMQLREES